TSPRSGRWFRTARPPPSCCGSPQRGIGPMPTIFDVRCRRSAVSDRILAGSAIALALLLAACGGDATVDAGGSSLGATRASPTSSVKFDTSLAPCEVVTADTVAATFDLPAHELEQTERSGMCLYRWKSGDQR